MKRANDLCFACDRPLGRSPLNVDTRDGQTVFVGRDCARLVRSAGDAGYQPPKGGPRLYPIQSMKDSEVHVGLVCLAQDDHGLWLHAKVMSVVRRSKPRRYVLNLVDGTTIEQTADQLRSHVPAPAAVNPPEPNTLEDRTRLWYEASAFFSGQTSKPPKGISPAIVEVLRRVYDDPRAWDENKRLNAKASGYVDQLLREPLKTSDWPSWGFSESRASDRPPSAALLVVNHHDRVAAAGQSIKLDIDDFAPESRAHVRLALNAIDAALIHLSMAASAVPNPARAPAFPAPHVSVVRSPKSKQVRAKRPAK